MPRHRVVELSTWLVDPKSRPLVISSEPLVSPATKRTFRSTSSSPRSKVKSPRKSSKKRQQPTPSASERTAAKIAVCHQINSLFRAQSSFAEAEQLAQEFYQHNVVATRLLNNDDREPLRDDNIIVVQLLESILDTLEESGPMAHVPCEVLTNLALNAQFKRLIALSEAEGITRALLLAAKHRDDGNALLMFCCQDLLLDI